MSLLTDTIHEINAIRRQLEDEKARIDGYLRVNQKQMQLVRESMQGSRNS